MASDGGGSPHDLVVTTWIMYSVAMLLFFVRLYGRWLRMRWVFQLEDYLMVVFYTAFVVTNIKIAEGGGSNLYKPGQYDSFTAGEIASRVKGSKIEFASENCQLCTIYLLKACMLMVYFRLTTNLWQNRVVAICAIYTLCGWIITELVLFLNCRPLSGYWTLPPPHEECSTYFRYEVVQFVFNLSSDVAILCVMLPMFARAQMAWKTKLPVIVVFSMGIVVIACAITSKFFTFKNIYDDSYQFWYLREASIGMYVTNLPFVWSLARSTLSFLKSSNYAGQGRYNDPRYETDPHTNTTRLKTGNGTRSSRHFAGVYEPRTARTDIISPSESEENIIELGGMDRSVATKSAGSSQESKNREWSQSDGQDDHYIRKTTEIIIQKN
ncbi:UbiD family decarboxylase [Aspergillus homomorphus CBS 101889]|uniref:UbiD family decarboxylase n=1 Tax=Aspergillus homomorphus (strain CBS 101889) TaxID=1450537 RepID=A0A395HXI2_ASPHC|nr:UbiD family decarboxylase [Aspergillus homomorphus CBS 101889]RAL12189.1 UbiD family decarboxylase [Aspergillus homomorphus CBS 101889]